MSEIAMRFTIEGRGPLLMHNGQLANPMAPVSRLLSGLAKKAKNAKTETAYAAVSRAEWIGGLYVDRPLEIVTKDFDVNVLPSGARVVVPGAAIKSMVVEAARKTKKGRDARAAIACDADWPLEYDGPTDPAELLNDPAFMDVRGVRVARARIMRARPIFRRWRLTFDLEIEPEVVNPVDVIEMVSVGGRRIGLLENRPDCGRFVVISAPDIGSAPKPAKKTKKVEKADG